MWAALPHGGQRRRWRTGGILIGIQPHHVLGEIAGPDERALRVGHLRQYANSRCAKTDTRGKSSSGEHGKPPEFVTAIIPPQAE